MLRDQEKVIIWTQLPATTLLLLAILRLLNIDVVILVSSQSAEERDQIIESFNHATNKAMILLVTYALGSSGLNLQYGCWRVHCLEAPHNHGVSSQALGRVRRLGNPSNLVYYYEYYVENTWDDQTIQRNIEKALPEAMAYLNEQIFNAEDDTAGGIDIGEWVIEDGKLVRFMDSSGDADILAPEDVLRAILSGAKGEHAKV